MAGFDDSCVEGDVEVECRGQILVTAGCQDKVDVAKRPRHIAERLLVSMAVGGGLMFALSYGADAALSPL